MYFDIATRLDTTRLERRLACSVSPAAVVLEPLYESLCETHRTGLPPGGCSLPPEGCETLHEPLCESLHESLHGTVPIGLASLLVAVGSLLKAVDTLASLLRAIGTLASPLRAVVSLAGSLAGTLPSPLPATLDCLLPSGTDASLD